MNRLFLTLEDGTVFEGWSVNDTLESAGLLSFYTGVVGYQEVVSDPANLGKIILFTYPLIGNYGVNNEDIESDSPKVAGIVTKEYSNHYSNFRAIGSLAGYLNDASVCLGTGFDTRAVLLHLRENGEMLAAISGEPMDPAKVAGLVQASMPGRYVAENAPVACGQAYPKIKASVVDLGASKSFYKYLSDMGVDACGSDEKAAITIVSDAPYYMVEDSDIIAHAKAAAKGRPVIGFGHGACIAAGIAGFRSKKMKFGDHGCNIPVKSVFGGRNEITVQNHNYEVTVGEGVQVIFTNVHDNSVEGFSIASERIAGANFLPNTNWFDILLKAVGVE